MRIVIPEDEAPEDSRRALAKMSEDDLMIFISDNFDITYYDVYEIDDVAWSFEAQSLYIKFMMFDPRSYKTVFVEAKVIDGKLVPEDKGSKPMSGTAMLKQFKQKHPGASKKFAICWK